MLEQHPMHSQNRPQSAMDTSTYSYLPNPTQRRMPTPNGLMTTSVKSVFDCELGCFAEDHNGEGCGGQTGHCGGQTGHFAGQSGHSAGQTGHSAGNGQEISPAKSEPSSHQHSSPTSQTSEPKDV